MQPNLRKDFDESKLGNFFNKNQRTMQMSITTLVREGIGKGKGIFMVQMRLNCGSVRSLVTTKIECTKQNLKNINNFNKITVLTGDGAKELNYAISVEKANITQHSNQIYNATKSKKRF